MSNSNYYTQRLIDPIEIGGGSRYLTQEEFDVWRRFTAGAVLNSRDRHVLQEVISVARSRTELPQAAPTTPVIVNNYQVNNERPRRSSRLDFGILGWLATAVALGGSVAALIVFAFMVTKDFAFWIKENAPWSYLSFWVISMTAVAAYYFTFVKENDHDSPFV